MAPAYSNKLTPSTPALSSALSNKINPAPINKLQLPYQKTVAAPIQTTKPAPAPLTNPQIPTAVKSSVTPVAPQQPVSPVPQSQAPAAPIQPMSKIPTGGLYAQLIQDARGAQERSRLLNQSLNQGMNNITKQPIALEFQQGQQTALQRDYGVQQKAASEQASNALTTASLAAPQPYGLTTQPYNPVEDTYGGGGSGGAINRAIQASNIGSAQDFESKIQQTQAQQTSAENNFQLLKSIASQGGVAKNAPIISTLRQILGQSVGGGESPQVVAFLTQLKGLNEAYYGLTGQTIPENVSLDQLQGIEQSLAGTTQNKIFGYQNQLSKLSGGAQNTSSGGNSNDPLGIL